MKLEKSFNRLQSPQLEYSSPGNYSTQLQTPNSVV